MTIINHKKDIWIDLVEVIQVEDCPSRFLSFIVMGVAVYACVDRDP